MQTATLLIGGRSEVLLEDARDFLTVLAELYDSFVRFEYLVNGEINEVRERQGLSKTNVLQAIQITPLATEDKLVLRAVRIGSDGFWEFVGRKCSLETIKDIISETRKFMEVCKRQQEEAHQRSQQEEAHQRSQQEHEGKSLQKYERPATGLTFEVKVKAGIREIFIAIILASNIFGNVGIETAENIVDRWMMKPATEMVYVMDKEVITQNISITSAASTSLDQAV